MKHVTLNIPDDKYSFFMELLENFEYIIIEKDPPEITEEQKSIVRERIDKSKDDPSRLLNWDEAKKKLKYKNA